MESQKFLKDCKVRFNLRNPKGDKATPIYLVVSINGKQYKFATNVKVHPRQWNNEKQLAVVSNVYSKLDNSNNRIANERLRQLVGYFSEFLDYLCNENNHPSDVSGLLRSFIYKDMEKTKSIDVVKTVNEAFTYYYKYIHQVKESSDRVNRDLLKTFTEYVSSNNLTADIGVFTQDGLNKYKEYLIDRMNREECFGRERVNKLCQLVERLINNVLVVNEDYRKYGYTPVKYVKLEDKRQQDDKNRFPLYDNEVQAIKDCTSLTEKEQPYRTLFLLQCAIGQRVSDLEKVIKDDCERKGNTITVQTKKAGVYAHIVVTEEVEGYLDEIRKLGINSISNVLYNKAIKNICQKSGLNRTIRWKDSRGKQNENPLWQIVCSHCARHTFITNKVKEGVPPEKLCLMTGHTDDEMIKKVYANLTKEDKRKIVEDLYGKKETGSRTEAKPTVSDNSYQDIEEVISIDDVIELEEGVREKDNDMTIYEYNCDWMQNDLSKERRFIEGVCYHIGKSKAVAETDSQRRLLEFVRTNQLNMLDLEFISLTEYPKFKIGLHNIGVINRLKRLISKGLVVCLYKGRKFPDQLALS